MTLRILLLILTMAAIGCDDPIAKRKEESQSPMDIMESQVRNERRANASPKPPNLELKILENGEPNYATMYHVLIGFKGSIDGRAEIKRTKEEAKKRAYEIYERAKSGENFQELVKQYSEDQGGSHYQLANYGQRDYLSKHHRSFSVIARGKFVKNVTDVLFKLEVGEIGIAEYHPTDCKFGWHVIKRVK